jgi:hypothetical protein
LDTFGGEAVAAVRNSVRVARRVVRFMAKVWEEEMVGWIGLN